MFWSSVMPRNSCFLLYINNKNVCRTYGSLTKDECIQKACDTARNAAEYDPSQSQVIYYFFFVPIYTVH